MAGEKQNNRAYVRDIHLPGADLQGGPGRGRVLDELPGHRDPWVEAVEIGNGDGHSFALSAKSALQPDLTQREVLIAFSQRRVVHAAFHLGRNRICSVHPEPEADISLGVFDLRPDLGKKASNH